MERMENDRADGAAVLTTQLAERTEARALKRFEASLEAMIVIIMEEVREVIGGKSRPGYVRKTETGGFVEEVEREK